MDININNISIRYSDNNPVEAFINFDYRSDVLTLNGNFKIQYDDYINNKETDNLITLIKNTLLEKIK